MIGITPAAPLRGRVSVPGSKYIANRVLPLAALAGGRSRLSNLPDNDDIRLAVSGLRALGVTIEGNLPVLDITGLEALGGVGNLHLQAGSSGTLARFITAIAALFTRPVTIDGSEQLRRRPMAPLLSALAQLQVDVSSRDGHLPVTVTGPLTGGACQLDAGLSSQFASALAIASTRAARPVTVRLTGTPVSISYLHMTVALIGEFGGNARLVDKDTGPEMVIEPGNSPVGCDYRIPADPVSASYFMAAALITGGAVTIPDLELAGSQQENRFYRLLEAMGAQVAVGDSEMEISATPAGLRAIDVDMGDMPDVVPTLAVLACFAKGTTHIRNIAQLAYKESDRIRDLAGELRKLGARVERDHESLTITGGELTGACVDSHDDHRLAMSLALVGLRVPGVILRNEQTVAKSFPGFWRQLESLNVQLERR